MNNEPMFGSHSQTNPQPDSDPSPKALIAIVKEGEYFCAIPGPDSLQLFILQWGNPSAITLERSEVERLTVALVGWLAGVIK